MSISTFKKRTERVNDKAITLERYTTQTTTKTEGTLSQLVQTSALTKPSLSCTSSACGTTRTISVGRYTLTLPLPKQGEPSPLYSPTKRAIDILAASTLLILLSPVFLLLAIIIYCEDRGPILYYQTRVGRSGQHFLFYKFRSMVVNADQVKAQLEARNEANGPIFKMKNDPRITRIGRFIRRYSLDELPQLFNVLRGEMSLVGPRPHLPREVALYTGRQEERLNVQPGLLCFREILGRSNLSFEDWVNLDLLYIEHRSLRTDFLILLRTIPSVLAAEGAY